MTPAPDLAIAIDLGGTRLRAALMRRPGEMLARRQIPTAAACGPDRVIAQMVELIDELTQQAGGAALAGIGIAAPGPLDPERGVVIGAPTLHGWQHVPLVALIARHCGLPVRIENDANAAALAEWRLGAGAGLTHMLYVTVSTGIGGGVIAGGRLLRGHRGLAGEIGHMMLSQGGPACGCGAHGCFEAMASGTALGAAARAALANGDGEASLISSMSGDDAVDARHITLAARAGDRLACRLLKDEARLLGRGFASLLHLYSPESIVMGGGVADAFEMMQTELHRAMRAAAMPAYHDVAVVQAKFGDDAGLVGAACLVWSENTS